MTKPGATFCSFHFVYTQDERKKKKLRGIIPSKFLAFSTWNWTFLIYSKVKIIQPHNFNTVEYIQFIEFKQTNKKIF